ncbi:MULTISPECIES: DUF2938 domain-containing protein [unclassified Rhizobium]|uniref:DUF2938 domain-containing protein n=1 Tax=unclassified Rhizobium TaxID=2613769 RepID=UPI001AD95B86|nr:MULTISPECIES: DUF2938 domain-containing protein [unclassified Rhizobium]MBO9098735.1 DUF2938 domain-containing protein [Rhizobium sp. L58/93]MBO9132460.1 DUF2938 domain-containing protein [Rhizobium sp. B209b/85]MBO9169001.1 DUF2938 domain-containing protein [Rhizobium sp. L245/93]MBO9184951.1 DUF2938 domain-containing protein [Rhizobium sp. E27B/91]QXZ85112.1 DUF2938 domain-containing protein [Rhizobium sp. K1/93]
MVDIFWRCLVIGIGATIFMDLWAILYARLSGSGMPNWAPVGRWFYHLSHGTVFHDDINASAPYAHELALGWIGHYAVGIAYAFLLVAITGPGWLQAPTFLVAWIWAIVTVAAGWFLLQPGLGIGWAASKTPNPNNARLLNLVAHTVFGFGLYGTALLIR